MLESSMWQQHGPQRKRRNMTLNHLWRAAMSHVKLGYPLITLNLSCTVLCWWHLVLDTFKWLNEFISKTATHNVSKSMKVLGPTRTDYFPLSSFWSITRLENSRFARSVVMLIGHIRCTVGWLKEICRQVLEVIAAHRKEQDVGGFARTLYENTCRYTPHGFGKFLWIVYASYVLRIVNLCNLCNIVICNVVQCDVSHSISVLVYLVTNGLRRIHVFSQLSRSGAHQAGTRLCSTDAWIIWKSCLPICQQRKSWKGFLCYQGG